MITCADSLWIDNSISCYGGDKHKHCAKIAAADGNEQQPWLVTAAAGN